MLETIPTRPAVVNDSNEPTHPHGADPKEDDNHSRSDFRPPPSERFDRLRDVLERDGPDPVAELEHVRAGIDHSEMVESQIVMGFRLFAFPPFRLSAFSPFRLPAFPPIRPISLQPNRR